MNILGIETSCDETAAAVVKDGREVLSNVVYTQIPLHQPYGGVVPEIASRAHIEKISQVVGEAMKGQTVDAVAVTYGPGLSPALIVGLNAAKGVAKGLGVPLMGIHHIEAHLHTPFLDSELNPLEAMPALGLAISGGNTMWVDMSAYGKYEVIGETLDDAAGEAFDKAAKLLGLGYPGGLKIDKMSQSWREEVEKRDGGGRWKARVFVDFAHTPDGLEKVLTAVRKEMVQATGTKHSLWIVFGAGGDRDPMKRPLMGEACAKLADRLVVTSDNPRSEDPLKIIDAIKEGIVHCTPTPPTYAYVIEPDRKKAIEFALRESAEGDVVIIAGKGHETTQEIKGVKYPFDDREVVRQFAG